MTATGRRRDVPDLPAEFAQLAQACAVLRPEDLSRFLPPVDGTGRHSAVLILLTAGQGGFDKSGISVLLIQRAADLRKHARQVAFPGGAVDPDDADVVAAALREASEEVGLLPESVEVFAELPALYIPVTRFIVHPVLGWWRRPHPVAPVDPLEVAGVAVVPIPELADPGNRFTVTHPSGWIGPAFSASGLFIWGFTAGLLDRLLEIAGWAQPWDRTRREALPPNLSGRPAPP